MRDSYSPDPSRDDDWITVDPRDREPDEHELDEILNAEGMARWGGALNPDWTPHSWDPLRKRGDDV